MKVLFSREIPGNIDKLFIKAGYEVKIMNEKRTQQEFYNQMKTSDAVITMLSDKISEQEIKEYGANLKIISNYAVGYNNIDIKSCSDNKIYVTNSPDALTDATADTAMTLILMCMRRIPESEKMLRENRFNGWKPNVLLGRDLKGKTLGILGMGRIGEAVARRAEAFGMNILYHTKSGVKMHLPYPSVSFETLLKESDIISIHCPLTDETKHMIGENELKQMKNEAVLINTARGPIINEEAFAKALESNNLFYGGCDVFEEEPKINQRLLNCENAVLLPHIGSATLETRTEMAKLTARSIIDALSGKIPELAVNCF